MEPFEELARTTEPRRAGQSASSSQRGGPAGPVRAFEQAFEDLGKVQAPPGLALRVLAKAREEAELRFRQRIAVLNGIASFGFAAAAVTASSVVLPAGFLAIAGLAFGAAAALATTTE